MKTLKTFLEVRRPKSADERKFMDKHIVVKHADRNGNGDDLFNAKNIKTIKRDKEGHGYDTGKDAKVYEAKLDEVSKEQLKNLVDGKYKHTITSKRPLKFTTKLKTEANLDEAPTKLTKGWGDGGRSMRANKAKLTGKNLPNDEDTGTPDHFSAARRRKRGLSENVQTAVLEYFDEMGIEVTEIELGELVEDLQEELLGELSNQTLKSYIKKAGRSAANNDDSAETMMRRAEKFGQPVFKDGAIKHAIKSVKRTNNIIKAAKKIKEDVELDEAKKLQTIEVVNKLTGKKSEHKVHPTKAYAALNHHRNNPYTKSARIKESNEELDELFFLTVEDLSDKNQVLITSLYESLDLENQINLVETLQEEDGLDAVLDFALESQLNELSKSTLKSYLNKSQDSIVSDSHKLYNKDYHNDSSKKIKANLTKRYVGTNLAQKKLKEENLDESCIAGTKKISSHEGKDGHTHEIRYDRDNEEYSVHHYKDGKHLGEGAVSYHSDKQEAKDQVAYDVKNFKR